MKDKGTSYANIDRDLAFLMACTDAELDPYLDALLGKDRKGRWASELELNPRYMANPNRPSTYVPELVTEFLKFGGSTFANLCRHGVGVSYKEVLCDVCKCKKVNFNKKQPVEMIEEALLLTVLPNVWKKMTDKERKEVLGDNQKLKWTGEIASGFFMGLFKVGGFKSYQIILRIVNYMWRQIFGKGLSLVVNAGLCKTLCVLTGPIGWIATGVWTVHDIASPAYRVTIPAVIYTAVLRRMMKERSKSKRK